MVWWFQGASQIGLAVTFLYRICNHWSILFTFFLNVNCNLDCNFPTEITQYYMLSSNCYLKSEKNRVLISPQTQKTVKTLIIRIRYRKNTTTWVIFHQHFHNNTTGTRSHSPVRLYHPKCLQMSQITPSMGLGMVQTIKDQWECGVMAGKSRIIFGAPLTCIIPVMTWCISVMPTHWDRPKPWETIWSLGYILTKKSPKIKDLQCLQNKKGQTFGSFYN